MVEHDQSVHYFCLNQVHKCPEYRLVGLIDVPYFVFQTLLRIQWPTETNVCFSAIAAVNLNNNHLVSDKVGVG